VHPFHLTFSRRPRALVITKPRARGARPRHSALHHIARLSALVMLVAFAIASTAGAAWLLAGGDASSIVGAALPLRSAGSLTPSQRSGPAPVAGRVPLRVASQPADARVLVDGHDLGATPLATAVATGPHSVTVRRNGTLDATCDLDVPAQGAALDVALWRAQPTAVKLRPAYPGATIADAQFLTDGRIALVLQLPATGDPVSGQAALREAWVLDPAAGRLDPFAPSIRAAAVAVSPDGARVAYLQQAPRPTPGQVGTGAPPSITGRLDEVWVVTQNDGQPLRRVFQLPLAERGSGYGTPPVEQLTDLACAPDGRRLLMATHIGDGASNGRARLLVLDADDAQAAPGS